MLEDLFGRTDYYEFPSFEVALFSLLLSFVLSSIIAIIYRLTYQGDRFPNSFFQAIVLSSMVSSMVIMAVGDNLAAGFGIIGAIAIIRFRTLIRDPRNIIFIFASLSVGIATGVYGYAIAIAGTAIFSTVAVLLYFSPFGPPKVTYLNLIFNIQNEEDEGIIDTYLTEKSIWKRPTDIRKLSPEEGYRYTYLIKLPADASKKTLFKDISTLPGVMNVRLSQAEEVQL